MCIREKLYCLNYFRLVKRHHRPTEEETGGLGREAINRLDPDIYIEMNGQIFDVETN